MGSSKCGEPCCGVAAIRLVPQPAAWPQPAQYHMPFAGRMFAAPYGRSCSAGALRTQSAQRAGIRSAITTASAWCRSSTCTKAQVAAARTSQRVAGWCLGQR